MKRFLILLEKQGNDFCIRVISVSERCKKDDVVFSDNTMAFLFIHTESTKNEVEAAYLGVRFSGITQARFSIKQIGATIDENIIYGIGKLIKCNDIELCVTKKGVSIPLIDFEEGVKWEIIED